MKKENKKPEEETEGSPPWMSSYCDMITILLACFIMLYALSTLDLRKFDKMATSIQKGMNRFPNPTNRTIRKPPISQLPLIPYTTKDILLKPLNSARRNLAIANINKYKRTQEIIIEGTSEGVRFSLAGRLLFQPGAALLAPEMEDILRLIAESLNAYPDVRLRIEGHTNSAFFPVNSSFRNHWKLAEARALAILRFLRDQGFVEENRLQYMSCGYFRPRFPNDDPALSVLNNRVEIVLLNGNRTESVDGILELFGEKIRINETDFEPPRR